MPKYILDLLFKAYFTDEELTATDQLYLNAYTMNITGQEFDYYLKINEIFYTQLREKL